MISGEHASEGGRAGDSADTRLSSSLLDLGLRLKRFKTGTPPRLDARTIDISRCEVQPADDQPLWLSRDGAEGHVDPFVLEAATNFPYDAPNVMVTYLQHEIGIERELGKRREHLRQQQQQRRPRSLAVLLHGDDRRGGLAAGEYGLRVLHRHLPGRVDQQLHLGTDGGAAGAFAAFFAAFFAPPAFFGTCSIMTPSTRSRVRPCP